jgi:hypothetical protein
MDFLNADEFSFIEMLADASREIADSLIKLLERAIQFR